MRGGQVLLKDCELLAQKGAALRCGTYASGTVERGKLTGAKRAVQVWEGATLELNAVQITAQERGVDVDEVKGRYGPSKVTVKGGVRQAPAPVWNGSGNTVSVDGVAVEATAKP
jgi:plastocyanin